MRTNKSWQMTVGLVLSLMSFTQPSAADDETDKAAYEAMVAATIAAADAKYSNKELWALNCGVEIKNGEPIKYISTTKKIYGKYDHSGAAGGGVVERDIPVNVEMKLVQGEKEHKIWAAGKYRFKDGKPIEVKPLEIQGLGPCLKESDPLKKYRKNKKLIALINEHGYEIGMPEEALLLSRGNLKANTSNYSGKIKIQYVDGNSYFYVEKGKLVSYQIR